MPIRNCSFMRLIVFVVLCAAWLFLAGDNAYSDTGNQVEVEGYATVASGLKDIARENALNDAFRRAVELAVGVIVESETVVENAQLISDKIYTKSTGYIKKYAITGEKIEDDTFKIMVRATVSLYKLEKDLGGMGLLMKKAGKPRIMILISEQNIMSDQPSNPLEGGVNMGVTENIIMNKLMERGFLFADKQVVLASVRDEIKPGAFGPNPDINMALKLAAMGEAEVVITGTAVAKAGNPLSGMNMRSCQAVVSVKVINADSGEPLTAVTANASVPHVNPAAGGSEALKKASLEVVEKIVPQILANWKKRVSGVHTVKLAITGLKFDRVKPFREFLKEQFDGIEEIYDRSFKNGVSKIDVEVSGSTKHFAEELSGKKFKGAPLDVVSFTSNAIEINVKQK